MAEHATFTASARVVLADPECMMRKLCEHFVDYGDVSVCGRLGSINTAFGATQLEACDNALSLRAEGHDATSLAYVKLSMSEHLLAFAGTEQPRIVWAGDGAAGQPLPYFREMRVTGARTITPHMRRITLAGTDLARFAVGGLHVRLLFPPANAGLPVWPVMGEDGRPSWPQGNQRPLARVYTIRSIDVARGEIEIDFVLHDDDASLGNGDGSPGARFASRAKPGDLVGMTGPGGGTAGTADWYLIAGDETALPAIARIVASLPATASAVVRIEVADGSDEVDLPSAATLDIGWLHRNGSAAGTTNLLPEAFRAVEWPQDKSVFAWAGCEHAAFRAIRQYLRQERGLSREEHLAVAYWRRGFDGDSARSEERG